MYCGNYGHTIVYTIGLYYKKGHRTFSIEKLVWKVVLGRTVYMGKKETPKSSDHPAARRSLASSCASSHVLVPAAQFLGWTNLKKKTFLWINSMSTCGFVFCALCRTEQFSLRVRLLQVRTITGSLRKPGFHNPRPNDLELWGEGLWEPRQQLIQAVTMKSPYLGLNS